MRLRNNFVLQILAFGATPETMPPKPGEKLETFPKRLAHLLKAKRISQVMLAHDVDATQSTVSRWLKGSMPDPKFAVALAKRLNVSLTWLLYGTDDGPSKLEAFLAEINEQRIPKIEAAIKYFSESSDANLEHVLEHVEHLKMIRQSLINLAEFAGIKGYPLGHSFLDRPNYELPVPSPSTRMTYDGLRDWLCRMVGIPRTASLEELQAAVSALASVPDSASIPPLQPPQEPLPPPKYHVVPSTKKKHV
jgi:transcriptional regulator with XRE-family HTH domain